MTSAERYRPAVLGAIYELEDLDEFVINPGRPPWERHVSLDWWTSQHVYELIHTGDPRPKYSYLGTGQKSPSPGRELVAKIINELRREGIVEYNPDSLGQESRWRLTDKGHSQRAGW